MDNKETEPTPHNDEGTPVDTCTDSEHTEAIPDFSTLPDVTWVQILSRLSLSERYYVSQTCQALLDVFNHPSLWSSQNISFMGPEDNYHRMASIALGSNRYLESTRRYGKYFQHLTIEVHGHLRAMSPEWTSLLQEVGSQCRLESLTLDIGKLTNRFHEAWGFAPEETCITPLISFIWNAFRMKRLYIRSWPMFEDIYQNHACNIFNALLSNPKLKELEHLSLFSLKNTEWSERQPKLLSCSATLNIVSHFQNLTHLSLRTAMITKALFEELSLPERTKLQVLQITVHYLPSSPEFAIPEIPYQLWHKLTTRHPELQVECYILLKVPQLELANLMKPDVPLTAITYMQYSAIDPQTLISLHANYNKSITKFLSYCESSDSSQYLTAIVSKSPKLTEFVYHGEITVSAVVALARMRGNDWKVFQVQRSGIVVPDEFTDADEDEVIRRRPDGELVMVDLMRFHQPEEYRNEAINTMEDEVSAALGYTWTALHTAHNELFSSYSYGK